MDANISQHMKQTASLNTDINILLLGETGVGKSTFINSFANYLQYSTLEKALNNELCCLIPTRFTIPDEDFVDRIVEIGVDNNEDKELGNSSTQGARAYVFPLGDSEQKIRLIDTPGIGDSRGLDQDEKNFENILSYISRFNELHAICFLLKPNVSVINPYFKFCIMHLFSRLEKSASKNIVFIFTNTRSTFYRPGDTLSNLKRILGEIEKNEPFVKIPCSKENIFCTDNESFRFLVALKQGIKFGERETNDFAGSWTKSVEASWGLVSYIKGDGNNPPLPPHIIQNTLSVNEARRVIIDLSKPLADISDLIHDNLVVLSRHQKTIEQENINKNDLQRALFIPAINIAQKELSQPVTICTSSSCSEIHVFAGLQKYHYKQRCHKPCYLTNVPVELIGSPELRSCTAMGGTSKCTKCRCDFSAHMHILYETELLEERMEDETVKTRIKTREDAIEAQHRMIKKLEYRRNEYEHEKEVISKNMAKFAHFLKENSITPYNDAYGDYLDYLIQRENTLGPNRNMEMIKRYGDLRKQYDHEKNILDRALSDLKKYKHNPVLVSSQDIIKSVTNLYALKHTGKKIKELHVKQQRVRKHEFETNMEYCHPNKVIKPTNSDNENVDGSDDDDDDDNIAALVQKLCTADTLDEARRQIRTVDVSKFCKNGENVEDKKQELWEIIAVLFSEYKKKSGGTESDTRMNNVKPKNNSGAMSKGAGNDNRRQRNFVRNPVKNCNNTTDQQNENYSNQRGARRRTQSNFLNQSYHQSNFPNQQGNLPNQQGNYPNQQGNYPNQQGNHPNQQGNYPNQQGNYPNQHGSYPNQHGNYSHQEGFRNQQGNYPNQQGNFPNQHGNYQNQQRNYPNQRGNYSNQQGNYPNQRGNFPNQQGNYPNPQDNFQNQQNNFPNLQGSYPNHQGNNFNQRGNFRNPPGNYNNQHGNHSNQHDNFQNLQQNNPDRNYSNHSNMLNQGPSRRDNRIRRRGRGRGNNRGGRSNTGSDNNTTESAYSSDSDDMEHVFKEKLVEEMKKLSSKDKGDNKKESFFMVFKK